MIRPLLISSLFVSAYAEDLVSLENGDAFKGKVIALVDGVIEVKSLYSDTPLRVIGDKLRFVQFDSKDTTELPGHSEQLNLRNGDIIPGKVTGLNTSTLTFDTWFAGQLQVPREQIDSIFFGVTPQKILYQGPRGIDGWEHDNDWEFFGGSLRSTDRGSIGRNLSLPEDFIFSVKAAWQSNPNMRIRVCADDPGSPDEQQGNHYLVNINTQGVQVKRVLPKDTVGAQYQPLISQKKNLSDINPKEITIELRVNRRDRMVHLYINGVFAGKGHDPKLPPSGTCVIFENLNPGRRDTQIRQVMVQEWDTITQRLRREPRADKATDTLSVQDGDRYSGTIQNYEFIDGQGHFTVKSPLLEKPRAIPSADCAVLYFSAPEKQKPSEGQFKLSLQSGGSLTLSKITLGNESLAATHPWLGNLNLDRRVLSEITQDPKAKKTAAKPNKAEAKEDE